MFVGLRGLKVVVAAFAVAAFAAPRAAAEPALIVSSSFELIRVDIDSGKRTTADDQVSDPELQVPSGVTVGPDGTIFAADFENFGIADGQVVATNPETGAHTLISGDGSPPGPPDFVTPWGIALEPGGTILVGDLSARSVLRVDPATGTRTVLTPNAGEVLGIDVSPAGRIFAASSGTIYEINPSTGARQIVASGSNGNFTDVAVAPDGSLIAVGKGPQTGGGDGVVVRVSPSGGPVTQISNAASPGPALNDPSALAVDPAGTIYVLDPELNDEGKVLRVDPGTGARTLVTSTATHPGVPFGNPIGLAFEPSAPASGGPGCVDAREALAYWKKQLKKAKKALKSADSDAEKAQAEKKLKKAKKGVKAAEGQVNFECS
jgi:sugar lactone lactonase YvrE